MRIRTLFRYLIGQRAAILEIAATPRALGIGLLFVLAAGFFREYDSKDLLHEPWHIAVPALASLGTSLVLFVATYLPLRLRRNPCPSFLSAYRSFLTLYWMTAPLAVIYAIPVERFTSADVATRLNLYALLLVACWRVLLMMRVVHVVLGHGFFASFFYLMLFIDVVALVALNYMPVPVIDYMSGAKPSESDLLIAHIAKFIEYAGWRTLPFWLAFLITALIFDKPRWQVCAVQQPSHERGLQRLAWAALAIGFLLLPIAQPEQIRKYRVETALREGRIAAALQEMSALTPEDFPPHWDPPPQAGPHSPDLLDLLELMTRQPTAPWVRSAYLQKLGMVLRSSYFNASPNTAARKRMARVLRQLPEGDELLSALRREAAGYEKSREAFVLWLNLAALEKSGSDEEK